MAVAGVLWRQGRSCILDRRATPLTDWLRHLDLLNNEPQQT